MCEQLYEQGRRVKARLYFDYIEDYEVESLWF